MSLLARLDALMRGLCGLRGHVWVRVVEGERVALECVRCLSRTPGWAPARPPAFTVLAPLGGGFQAWVTTQEEGHGLHR